MSLPPAAPDRAAGAAMIVLGALLLHERAWAWA
jgi:hypothetical protein